MCILPVILQSCECATQETGHVADTRLCSQLTLSLVSKNADVTLPSHLQLVPSKRAELWLGSRARTTHVPDDFSSAMLGLHLRYRRAISLEVMEHDVAHMQDAFSRHARAPRFSCSCAQSDFRGYRIQQLHLDEVQQPNTSKTRHA